MASHKDEDSPFRVRGRKTEYVCIGGVKRWLDVVVGDLRMFSSDYFDFCSVMGSKVLVGVWGWEKRRTDR